MAREPQRPRILLVEDDADVRETTALVLERHGFIVETAEDGERGAVRSEQGGIDVAVVDVALPGMNGLELTRHIKGASTIPVLLLTARDTTRDIVDGLESGADDYVTKPYDGAILVARIRALLRRAHGTAGDADQFGPYTMDRRARRVTDADGAAVSLTRTEFRLLELLADNMDAVVHRRDLLRAIWGADEWIDERVVNTNVQRLRLKLGGDVIKTVRGVGYRLESRSRR